MIASSHSADGKVYQIAKLNEEVKALRSTYVDTRAKLMELKMESFLRNKMKDIYLFPSEKPPCKDCDIYKKTKALMSDKETSILNKLYFVSGCMFLCFLFNCSKVD